MARLIAILTALAAVGLPGCLGPDPQPNVENGIPGANTTASPQGNFSWLAMNYSGNLALGFSLAADDPAECRVRANYTGLARDDLRVVGVWLAFSRGSVIEAHTDTFQGGLPSGSVHVRTPAGDVNSLMREPTPYGTSTGGDVAVDSASSPISVVMGFRDLRPANTIEPPFYFDEQAQELGAASLRLDVNCDGPVVLGEWRGSGEAILFDEWDFQGGAGLTVESAIDASSAMVGSQVRLDVASSEGLVFVDVLADLLLNHVAVGAIRIWHPDGEDLLVDRPREILVEAITGLATREDFRRIHSAGPGEYGVEATWAGVDLMGRVTGAVLGLEPVSHLDELLSPPSETSAS